MSVFEQSVIQDAAAMRALTEQEAEDIVRQKGDRSKVQVIPNGVDLLSPDAAPHGRIFRDRFGIPPAAPLVLFLGQLIPIKGLDLLLKVVARVRERIADLLLAIAGPDRGYGADLRSLADRLGIAKQVIFTGHLDGELKWSAFRAADVFSLTSYSEGLPVAVLEACSLGVPVLVTDQCHLPEIEGFQAGHVGPTEVEPLARFLHEMLTDAPGRRQMSINARRMIAERFSMDQVVRQLESMYESVGRGR